jgi:hypothetical protein
MATTAIIDPTDIRTEPRPAEAPSAPASRSRTPLIACGALLALAGIGGAAFAALSYLPRPASLSGLASVPQPAPARRSEIRIGPLPDMPEIRNGVPEVGRLEARPVIPTGPRLLRERPPPVPAAPLLAAPVTSSFPARPRFRRRRRARIRCSPAPRGSRSRARRGALRPSLAPSRLPRLRSPVARCPPPSPSLQPDPVATAALPLRAHGSAAAAAPAGRRPEAGARATSGPPRRSEAAPGSAHPPGAAARAEDARRMTDRGSRHEAAERSRHPGAVSSLGDAVLNLPQRF